MNETKKTKILFVDDDAVIREIISNKLKKNNLSVQEVENGEEALKTIKEFTPDLILLDIEMPKMNGYVTCEKVRQADEFKDLPIIFLTAMTEDWELLKGFMQGCHDYIVKPDVIDDGFIESLLSRIHKYT